MKTESLLKICLVLVSISSAVCFLALSGDRALTGDEIQYELLGRNLALGNGYTLSVKADYEPTALREPGYPFFIAVIYYIFGQKLIFICLIQVLLFMLSCLLLFTIVKEICGVKIAQYSAFLMAICPTLANYSVILYSESFFTFLLCLTVYLALRANKTGKISLFVALGFVLGFLVLTKCAFIFFSIFIALFFFISRNKNISILRCALNVTILLVIFTAMLIPWFYRNYRLFGITNLTSRGEIVLLSRALRTEYSPEKIKAAYLYYISVYLGSQVFPGIVDNPHDFMLIDDHYVFELEKELQNKGFLKKDISMILRNNAINKIKMHPFKYLLFTPLELLKMMGFMHVPFLSEPYGIVKFKAVIQDDFFLVLIRGLCKSAGYIIVILSLIGSCLTIKKWRHHFLVLSLIVYVNIVYSLLNGYPRFSVPLVPFYLVYATIALVKDKKEIQ